jgi:hypothetical protein
MFKPRFLSAPGNYLLFGATALFAASSVALKYPDGRGRLAALDMSCSRGGGYAEVSYLCSNYAGYAACSAANFGDPCNICGQNNSATYNGIGGVGQAIDPPSGGAVNCGTIWNGACVYYLQTQSYGCSTANGGNTKNNCPQPQGPPSNET